MPVPFEIVRRRVIFRRRHRFYHQHRQKSSTQNHHRREEEEDQLATAKTTTIQSENDDDENKRSISLSNLSKTGGKSSAKIDKKTIASLGSACLLSYGFVSNLFYVSSLLLATYTAIKTTGQSPVTSSESLKIFASSYFGLWMIQNVIRPGTVRV